MFSLSYLFGNRSLKEAESFPCVSAPIISQSSGTLVTEEKKKKNTF